jgi:hypothetical protein
VKLKGPRGLVSTQGMPKETYSPVVFHPLVILKHQTNYEVGEVNLLFSLLKEYTLNQSDALFINMTSLSALQ